MKTRRRSAKKSSLKTKVAIISLIAITAIIIIAAIHQQTQNEAKTLKDPNEYFQFLDAQAQGSRVSQDAIRIEYLQFNLTPVGGDAHNIVIFTEGMTSPQDYWYEEIKNGTEKTIQIQFASQIQVTKQPDGTYLLKVQIRSDETEKGQHIFRMKVDEEIGQIVFLVAVE
ncbi:MAG: hypothetical protein ACPLW8_05560 [Candidatus Bathyarchaeales archaeon]